MVRKPLITQGYSLAEEVANSISHGSGWCSVSSALCCCWCRGGYKRQRDGDRQLQPVRRQHDYAVPRFHALSRDPASAGETVAEEIRPLRHLFADCRDLHAVLLVGLNSPLAKGLMIVIWSPALLGILFKLTIAHRFKILSLVTYLTMGWLSLIVVYQLAVKLAVGGVTLLAVGGVVYSLGVIFYVCKRIPYNHAIWHGFVLGGSVCHFWRFIFTSASPDKHPLVALRLPWLQYSTARKFHGGATLTVATIFCGRVARLRRKRRKPGTFP